MKNVKKVCSGYSRAVFLKWLSLVSLFTGLLLCLPVPFHRVDERAGERERRNLVNAPGVNTKLNPLAKFYTNAMMKDSILFCLTE